MCHTENRPWRVVMHFVVLPKTTAAAVASGGRQMIITPRESDKTRSTGSLIIIIIISIFSSCTIGIVTTTTTVGPRVPETARRRRRSCLIGGLSRSRLVGVFLSFIRPVCVCVRVRVVPRRRRSQWKRLARRPLIWPCKVSGARLMKTLFYIYIIILSIPYTG